MLVVKAVRESLNGDLLGSVMRVVQLMALQRSSFVSVEMSISPRHL